MSCRCDSTSAERQAVNEGHRETRGGLTSYPPDPSVARGHLAATVTLQMQTKPHIVHIVGHTEAHHATTAEELIEASRIADGVISQCLLGLPDMTADPRVQGRKEQLLEVVSMLVGLTVIIYLTDRFMGVFSRYASTGNSFGSGNVFQQSRERF